MRGSVFAPLRVVVADDSPEARLVLRLVLRSRAGVEVVGEACHGEEAVRLVERERPDVVLLDVAMPGVDGLEAAARIRRDHRDLRIVVLSAYAAKKMETAALAAGADAYVEKSAPPDALFDVLAQLFPHADLRPLREPPVAREVATLAEATAERRYRMLLDALEEGVLVVDASGSVVESNFAAARLLAAPTSGLFGRPIRGLLGLPGDDPVSTTLATGRPCSQVPVDVVVPSGVRHVSVSARATMVAAPGAPPAEVLLTLVPVNPLEVDGGRRTPTVLRSP